jgi:hypothetical protein
VSGGAGVARAVGWMTAGSWSGGVMAPFPSTDLAHDKGRYHA